MFISDGHVACMGQTACGKSTISAPGSSSFVRCYGEKACYKSTIEAGRGLYSFGWYGGKNSQVYNTKQIKAYGYYSMAESIIDSQGLDSMDIEAYGYCALHHAEIYCRAGSTCHMDCKGIYFHISICIHSLSLTLFEHI